MSNKITEALIKAQALLQENEKLKSLDLEFLIKMAETVSDENMSEDMKKALNTINEMYEDTSK